MLVLVPKFKTNFEEILSRVETRVHYLHTCDFSSDNLDLLKGRIPGQLPGSPACRSLRPDLVFEIGVALSVE